MDTTRRDFLKMGSAVLGGAFASVAGSSLVGSALASESGSASASGSTSASASGSASGSASASASGSASGSASASKSASTSSVSASSVATEDIVWDSEADAIVLGCGTGGTSGALDLYDAGNSVIIVEKQTWLGGDTRRCGGGISAPNSCVQKALGVEDNTDDFYGYIVACGEGMVDEDMLRTFVDRATGDFDWIVQDLAGQTEADWAFTNGTDGQDYAMVPGLCLSGTPVYYEQYGYTPIPRCYWFKANPDDVDEDGTRGYCPAGLLGRPDTDQACGGTGLWKPFQDAIDARDFEIHMSTSLQSLITDETGAVIGAKCHDLTADKDVYYKAKKGVLLATGDWQNNEQMRHDYLFDTASSISITDSLGTSMALGPFTGMADADQGDGAGILAAMAIGAGTQIMIGGPWRGGLKTDTSAQVLDALGNPIPRLYASSYAVGGKYGLYYPFCGLHNMWNIAFSRIAAASIDALEPME